MGATLRVASHARRVTTAIATSLLSPSRSLRFGEVVARILHLPEQHHLMVFVDGVVAVHRIAAAEIAEPHDQLDLLVELQSHDILPREFHVAALNLTAVAPDDPEFLQVDVNRVLPAAGAVPQDPSLGGVALNGETEPRAVHQLSVDLPLTVAALEPEAARQADPIFRRRRVVTWQER